MKTAQTQKLEPAPTPIQTRKKLKDLFDELCAIEVSRTLMHQGFQIPNATTESTLSAGRPGLRDLKMVYHPGYGLIGFYRGTYFLAPSANVIVAHE